MVVMVKLRPRRRVTRYSKADAPSEVDKFKVCVQKLSALKKRLKRWRTQSLESGTRSPRAPKPTSRTAKVADTRHADTLSPDYETGTSPPGSSGLISTTTTTTTPSPSPSSALSPILVTSPDFIECVNTLPRVLGRARATQDLIDSFAREDLKGKLRVCAPVAVNQEALEAFHTTSYLQALRVLDQREEVDLAELEEFERSHEDAEVSFGLVDDCPPFEGMWNTVSVIAGASLTAAHLIATEQTKIAINFNGGWHHGRADMAEGFCYVNDVVLAIMRLRKKKHGKRHKILYVDIDLHHGDGVAEAFEYSPDVMVLSFHKFAKGFYPGTGNPTSVGKGKGKYTTLNVSVWDNIGDDMFVNLFKRVVALVMEAFQPEYVVCVCGSDGLAHDPHMKWNLTSAGIAKCCAYLFSFQLGTCLLGGGGYNTPDAARTWAVCTGIACGVELDVVPVSCPNFEDYIDGLHTMPSCRRPCLKRAGEKEMLEQCVCRIQTTLEKYRAASGTYKAASNRQQC